MLLSRKVRYHNPVAMRHCCKFKTLLRASTGERTLKSSYADYSASDVAAPLAQPLLQPIGDLSLLGQRSSISGDFA